MAQYFPLVSAESAAAEASRPFQPEKERKINKQHEQNRDRNVWWYELKIRTGNPPQLSLTITH